MPSPDELPVNVNQSMHRQSMDILRAAEGDRLITWRWWTDMGDPAHVKRHLDTFGPDFLPEDQGGMYYVLLVRPATGKRRVPVVLPEGEVRPFILSWALHVGGLDLAWKYLYRWSLIPDPGLLPEPR